MTGARGSRTLKRMDDAPILICYDSSEASERAIDAAAELLADRHAIVLNVAPFLTTAESYALLTPTPYNFEELNLDSALEQAHAGAETARRAGLTAEARADIGAPTWDGVVEVADELDAAVIVIGSRGLTGAREAVKGSLSHELAEHAGRPVLIVPPPRAKDPHVSST
jgi:nucleotide-binding universal stress UspA family protein